MDFIQKLTENKTRLIGFIAILCLGLIVLNFVFKILGVGLGMQSVGYGSRQEIASTDAIYAPTVSNRTLNDMPELSVQNVKNSFAPTDDGDYAQGDTAEEFEVKEYSAQIETRNLDRDCALVGALKSRPDVIFEHANKYERGCVYSFKVEKGSIEDVLNTIKTLNPRELTENTYTIKREMDDFTSEIQILQNKLASLDATLAQATASYENITSLATARGDVESLAKIIESKLTIIERLTNARIETGNQLERIARAKADALDRLEYTYFSVSIYKNEYVDAKQIKDSWKSAVQMFIRDVNILMQELSIGFVAFVLTFIKYALYFTIFVVFFVFIGRFTWDFTRKMLVRSESGRNPQ